jgi:hypothetical protein
MEAKFSRDDQIYISKWFIENVFSPFDERLEDPEGRNSEHIFVHGILACLGRSRTSETFFESTNILCSVAPHISVSKENLTHIRSNRYFKARFRTISQTSLRSFRERLRFGPKSERRRRREEIVPNVSDHHKYAQEVSIILSSTILVL